jgi:hypothetical protein
MLWELSGLTNAHAACRPPRMLLWRELLSTMRNPVDVAGESRRLRAMSRLPKASFPLNLLAARPGALRSAGANCDMLEES